MARTVHKFQNRLVAVSNCGSRRQKSSQSSGKDLRPPRTQADMLEMKNHRKSLNSSVLQDAFKELGALPVGDLRKRFYHILGYSSRSRNRTFLVRKILWGMQACEFGDISAESKKKSLELADDRDVSVKLPVLPESASLSANKRSYRFSPTLDSRLPVLGSVLVREYKGRQIRVSVGKDDFEFEGERYRSLSAIARKVTGSSYNGFLFFKIK